MRLFKNVGRDRLGHLLQPCMERMLQATLVKDFGHLEFQSIWDLQLIA